MVSSKVLLCVCTQEDFSGICTAYVVKTLVALVSHLEYFRCCLNGSYLNDAVRKLNIKQYFKEKYCSVLWLYT